MKSRKFKLGAWVQDTWIHGSDAVGQIIEVSTDPHDLQPYRVLWQGISGPLAGEWCGDSELRPWNGIIAILNLLDGSLKSKLK